MLSWVIIRVNTKKNCMLYALKSMKSHQLNTTLSVHVHVITIPLEQDTQDQTALQSHFYE